MADGLSVITVSMIVSSLSLRPVGNATFITRLQCTDTAVGQVPTIWRAKNLTVVDYVRFLEA